MAGKHGFWLFIAAVVVALIALASREQPVIVEALTPTVGPMTVSIREEGRTRLRHHYDLAAPIAGEMDRVELEVGDTLVDGDLVTAIHPATAPLLDPRTRAEATSAVAAAQAAVAAAQAHEQMVLAEEELARSELARAEPIFADGTLSAVDIERLRSAVRRNEAHVRQAGFETGAARSRLEAAQAVLASYEAPGADDARIEVRTPVGGVVTEVVRESRGPIAQGERIAQVGRLEDLEIEVDVLSADAVRIEPGGEVIVHRWGGDTPLTAVVDRVEPVGFMRISALGVEEQRVWVICQLTAPAELWQRLGAGYRVEAEFVLWRGEEILQIDSSSLFRNDDGWAVFAVDGDRARLRSVDIGRRAGLRTQILAGLEADDRIVTHPDERLEDGVRIEVVGT